MLIESNEESRRAALRARNFGRLTESAIYDHIAARFSSVTNLEDFNGVIDEVRELASWLPIPTRHRNLSHLEKKAKRVSFIRSLKVDPENESLLICLAMTSPGRPAESRRVAVSALDMRNDGKAWAEIESTLLAHRQNVRNPGESIRNEVRLLKRALARYRVRMDP
jgi:hypothetical protein